MGEKDVVDHGQLGDGEVGDAGTGIDEDVMVHKQRSGAQMSATDSAAASQDSQLHGYLVLKILTPSQPGPGGSFRR